MYNGLRIMLYAWSIGAVQGMQGEMNESVTIHNSQYRFINSRSDSRFVINYSAQEYYQVKKERKLRLWMRLQSLQRVVPSLHIAGRQKGGTE